MKTIKAFYLTFLLIIYSCSSIYIPSMTSNPLIEDKGETQLNMGVSSNSIHFSGDYAFSEKYSIQLSGNISFHNFSERYDIFTTEQTDRIGELFTPDYNYGEFSHRYAEIGLGRYNLINSTWKLEIFTGLGYGNAYEEIGNINSDYILGFVQGNIGKKLKTKNFEFGFACRVGYSNFDLTYDNFSNSSRNGLTFDNIGIEPAAFIRTGFNSLRFYTKLGGCYIYSLKSMYQLDLGRGIKNGELNYTPLHFSIGINYIIGNNKVK